MSIRSLLFPMNAAQGAKHSLTVNYTALPITLKTSYTRHELENPTLNDSLRGLLDTAKESLRQIAATQTDTSHADVLSNFQKSGSHQSWISSRVESGSESYERLPIFNFSGDVAKDVNITGALTEEQTPIQPEGTTQTLNEIDNIFIRIKAGEHLLLHWEISRWN